MRRAALLLLFLVTGCSATAFDRPVLLSTSSRAVPPDVRRLGTVETHGCETFYFIVPVHTGAERIYDDLSERARAMGGDAIVDIEHRDRHVTMAIPFYRRDCWSVSATAVRLER
jgi:hypothetical protein